MVSNVVIGLLSLEVVEHQSEVYRIFFLDSCHSMAQRSDQ